ncbi:MAG: hypothetical protein WBO70_06140, partial [Erysipelotrichaceae bacterium]
MARQINALSSMADTGIIITSVNINTVQFVAAKAETATLGDGVDGSYDFTVTFTKGSENRTTSNKKATIKYNVYSTETDSEAVLRAKNLIQNGTYTFTQAIVNSVSTAQIEVARQINALTGMNTTGITINSSDVTITDFVAATAGNAATPNGNNGSFKFKVMVKRNALSQQTDEKAASITATKFTGLTDLQAVTNVKTIIENGTYAFTQAVASNEGKTKTDLVRQINALSGMSTNGITISEANVTITDFKAAVAETSATSDGVNGSFKFT